MTITLYDLPYNVPGDWWSPNPTKVRIALNFKGLQFKTEWVETPDIESVLKKIGASPTSKKPDGRDHYTLPVIHDSKTGKIISDSWKIAEYLDVTYPDTPTLFPRGSVAAIATMEHVFMKDVIMQLYPMAAPLFCAKLNPSSEAYYRKGLEERFGCKLEELAPPGAKRDAIWNKAKDEFALFGGFLDKNGRGKTFFLGDTFTYADVILAAFVASAMKALDGEQWRAIASLNDGRWGDIVQSTEKYWKTS